MYGSLVAQFTKETKKGLADFPIRMSADRKMFLKEMIMNELDELFDATTIKDEQDAIADIVYYAIDQSVTHGVDLDPIFTLVHKANMRKRFPDGTFHQRGDGKVIKPEGWTPEDDAIQAELDNQYHHRSFRYGSGFQDHYYLSSPYSHEEEYIKEQRFDAACEAYITLLESGLIVFAPIPFCHSVASLYSLHTNFTYWERQDYYFVRTCRSFIVLMLDGWKESVGVQAELAEAQKWGKQILYMHPSDEELAFYANENCDSHAKAI